MSYPRILQALVVPIALGAAAVGGCRSKKTPIIRLHDTEGRQLLAKCDDRQCQLKQKGGPIWPGTATKLVVQQTGLVVALCNVAPEADAPADPRFCRALECVDDRECPPPGFCINGLCVDPARDLTTDDAIVLCLAGKGLGHDAPPQVQAYALGLNCGSPCKVPRACRSPR